MSYREFLKKLKRKKLPKGIWQGAAIRVGYDFTMCPVSCLANLDTNEWEEAAKEIGLRFTTASKIVNAADLDGGYDPKVRADLLRACGLA